MFEIVSSNNEIIDLLNEKSAEIIKFLTKTGKAIGN
jgi:hypothetical protein